MEPKGIECYSVTDSLSLQFPFSKFLLGTMETLKNVYDEDVARMEDDISNFDDNGDLTNSAIERQMERFRRLSELNLDPRIGEIMQKYFHFFFYISVLTQPQICFYCTVRGFYSHESFFFWYQERGR